MLGLVGQLDEAGEGYIPSPLSLKLAVDSKTDYKPVEFAKNAKNKKKKVLVICTEERYMVMANGKKFSSGNHPVEMGQPLIHLMNAGFDFDVATPTGRPACIEMWALPKKDDFFMEFFETKCKPKIDSPLSLETLASNSPNDLEPYVLFFMPGGQGAMLGLPEDKSLEKVLKYAKSNDLLVMSVCHGPAALLACKDEPHPYKGYNVACFPDAVDKQTPMVGYLPGVQTWYFGEKLIERGLTIENKNPDDTVVFDRKLLTGASPKACQKLGTMAAEALLAEYAT